MGWSDLLLRLRALIFRRQAECDLEDELAFHVEMQTRKNVAAGMDEAAAKRRAQIQFGGAAHVSEECRDQRGVGPIETTWQDIRYAMLGFRRSPTLVLTVVATIALGLGLDTALFTIFDATYLRPVGVHNAQALYEVYWLDRGGNGHDFSWSEYREFLASNPSFSAAFGFQNADARVEGHDFPGTLVTGDYFDVLGVSAAFGRTLLPEDAKAPGGDPVIVLSYRAWKDRFSGDPQIIGRKILLRGYPFEVVGVAAEGFAGLGSRPSEFWAPVTMAVRFETGAALFGSEHPRHLSIVGRLRADFGVGQAQAGLTLWTQRLTADAPVAERSMRGELLSRATSKPLRPGSMLAFLPLLAAISLVLLIGCVNVANLMLARSLSRQREIGIRLSLGASRRRLVRQLLTECVLLALPAAVAGVAVSEAAIRICLRVLLATLPPSAAGFAARIPNLHTDIRVFAFALGGALVSAVAFGLAPALQATRGDFTQVAKGEFGGPMRPSRMRDLLVAGQVTTCVLLLVTAGFLLRGVGRMHDMDASLSARHTVQLVVQEKAREAVLSRLAAEPSVTMVAAARNAPVERKTAVTLRTSDGGPASGMASNAVSPEYFALYEIPILRGRAFNAAEALSAAPVAVVSEAAAQLLWPNQDAVGRSLTVDSERTVTVIGVARDELSRWIDNGEARSLVYFPANLRGAGNELLVGLAGDAEGAKRKIEADLMAIDPEALLRIETIQVRQWVEEDAYYTMRVAYWLASAVGVLALLLTLSGIYGVLSYVISQRTKEIGIRIALGATTRAVTALVLRQSMRLAVFGSVVGCVLAIGLAKVLASVLVMIDTFDPVALAGGVALVLAACAAAAYFPSRRAARIDPLTTLRYD